LYSRARVERVLLEGDRAVGVVASARREDGSSARITVRAAAVALAAGAAGTPKILLANRLANSSGRVGHGLTLHPASYAWARFDHDIRGWSAVPQGYGVEEFADVGLRFEGAFLPLEAAAATLGHVGARWTQMVEAFDKLACFGFMISDTSRGRVTLGRDGRASMRYWLNDADRKQIIRGHAILARIYLAAGARAVFPGLRFFDVMSHEDDVARFEREAPSKLLARHIDVSAYHPLGSCRMGADPRRYVVSPEHETHDVRGLFVCDGSAVPGPLGVNPQMTIMAFSERAATYVERRIEAQRARTVEPRRRAVAFAETMAGELLVCRGARAGERVSAEFRVHATRTDGTRFALAGVIDIPSVARQRACEGTLTIRPLARRRTLAYELRFADEDGARLWLRGVKRVGLSAPLRGMTELDTEVCDEEGRIVAAGQLRFDLRDLWRWLMTWRLT
ncbi:MAG: GMC family oxidoreductase N-terminal domain-containing protein, partial [Myxococcales bacterium]|nr:GMC family oxidoreductase N-terminal domain-containing protein [Myxococcales bacterium]